MTSSLALLSITCVLIYGINNNYLYYEDETKINLLHQNDFLRYYKTFFQSGSIPLLCCHTFVTWVSPRSGTGLLGFLLSVSVTHGYSYLVLSGHSWVKSDNHLKY